MPRLGCSNALQNQHCKAANANERFPCPRHSARRSRHGHKRRADRCAANAKPATDVAIAGWSHRRGYGAKRKSKFGADKFHGVFRGQSKYSDAAHVRRRRSPSRFNGRTKFNSRTRQHFRFDGRGNRHIGSVHRYEWLLGNHGWNGIGLFSEYVGPRHNRSRCRCTGHDRTRNGRPCFLARRISIDTDIDLANNAHVGRQHRLGDRLCHYLGRDVRQRRNERRRSDRTGCQWHSGRSGRNSRRHHSQSGANPQWLGQRA